MPCTLHTFLHSHCGCAYHLRDNTHSNPSCNTHLNHTIEYVEERCNPRCTRTCPEEKRHLFKLVAKENSAAELATREQQEWVLQALEELEL